MLRIDQLVNLQLFIEKTCPTPQRVLDWGPAYSGLNHIYVPTVWHILISMALPLLLCHILGPISMTLPLLLCHILGPIRMALPLSLCHILGPISMALSLLVWHILGPISMALPLLLWHILGPISMPLCLLVWHIQWSIGMVGNPFNLVWCILETIIMLWNLF